MALQKATQAGNATAFKFEKAGDTLKGYYQGQVTKTINGSPAVEHTYKTATGLVSVLGQANVLNQIKNNSIEPGNYVEITFSGQTQKLKGGRTMKVYDVAFDRDDTDTTSQAGASYEDDGVDDDAEESDLAPYVAPSAPKSPATPPSAERQAAVRALLKRK